MAVSRPGYSAVLVQQRVGALRRTLAGARSGDVRAVHQARVATRRLREVMPLVEAGKPGRRLERMARSLTSALGPVREMDVELMMLDELERGREVPAPAIAVLRRAITTERGDLHRETAQQIDQAAVDTLQKKVLRAIERHGAGRTSTAERQEQVAAARGRAARRAANLERIVDEAGSIYLPERLHRVRIAVKKLRYALEIVKDVSGSRSEARIRSLKKSQELLGRMHDIEVLIARTRTLQAAAVADLRLSSDLDQLVRRLETDARQLHAQYIASRRVLVGICERVVAAAEPRR